MRWVRAVVSALLAGVAGAGLFATSTNDLRVFSPVTLNAAWLVPGVIVLGILVALANGDGAWAAGAMGGAALLGAFLVGGAIAAPGARVEPIRTTMINNGTIQALAVFLLMLIFGMIGVVATLVLRAMTGRADL